MSVKEEAIQREYHQRVQRWRDGHDVQMVGIQVVDKSDFGNAKLSLVSSDKPYGFDLNRPSLRFEDRSGVETLIVVTYNSLGMAVYLPPDPQRAVWIRKWLRKWSRRFEPGLVIHILPFL